MKMRLSPEVEALVVPGPFLAPRPQLRVDSPALVVTSPSLEPGSIDALSFGSFDWLWDEREYWAFGITDGMLLALILTVPEVNRDSAPEPSPAEWNTAETTTGVLNLPYLRFGRVPGVERWYEPTGAELFGFYATEAATSAARAPLQRLAIAEGTYLLTANSTLTGWSITDPARYITGAAVPPRLHGTEPDARLRTLLAEFFRLVTEENVDQLEEGDLELKRELVRLAEHLEVVGGAGEPRAVEILNKVRQVLEDYA